MRADGLVKAKQPEFDDQLIIARTRTGPVYLPVDAVSGVIERSAENIKAHEEIARGRGYAAGTTKLDDQILFITIWIDFSARMNMQRWMKCWRRSDELRS